MEKLEDYLDMLQLRLKLRQATQHQQVGACVLGGLGWGCILLAQTSITMPNQRSTGRGVSCKRQYLGVGVGVGVWEAAGNIVCVGRAGGVWGRLTSPWMQLLFGVPYITRASWCAPPPPAMTRPSYLPYRCGCLGRCTASGGGSSWAAGGSKRWTPWSGGRRGWSTCG